MDDLTWTTSSYSGDTSLCVEVGWRTPSRSGPNGGQCVEAALCMCGVKVRDTKDRSRAAIAVGPDAWRLFLTGLAGV